MVDEPGLGEVVRRLDRLEVRLEELIRELALRLVSADVYSRDQREAERRFTEMERDLIAEVEARKAADTELRDSLSQQGSNWRQAVYAGVIPGALFLIGILLQLKGGK